MDWIGWLDCQYKNMAKFAVGYGAVRFFCTFDTTMQFYTYLPLYLQKNNAQVISWWRTPLP